MRHTVIDLKTGRSRPAMPQPPVLSSAGHGWDGLVLEEHAGCPVESLDVAVPHLTVCMQLTPARVELKISSSPWQSLQLAPGHVGILPPLVPLSVRTHDSGAFVALTLDATFISCAAHGLARLDRTDLIPHQCLNDPLLESGVRALQTEAAAGGPGGRLYAESLAATMAVHLMRHYAADQPAFRFDGRGLAPAQLRRVLDFIQAHLEEDLALARLAAVAGLSPFHFSRVFKQSTGLPPHQYVIQCRLERARSLLLANHASVADVALQAGFCDQSHLALHFKRALGLSPTRFRHLKGRSGK